jgi:DNA-binding beta-propeller fold protein YncE
MCTARLAVFSLVWTSLLALPLVAKANPPKNRVIANLKVSYPTDAVCSPDNQYVYVASNNSALTQGQIVVISVATHEIVSQFVAGAQALSLAISPDGQTLYSCDDNSNVQVISTTSQTLIKTIDLDIPLERPYAPLLALSPDGTSLWVDTKGIYVIATATGQIASTPIPLAPQSLAFTPDGTEVYASYFSPLLGSGLALIDASSLTVTNQALDGKATKSQHTIGPQEIAISPDGKELYFTSDYRPAHQLLCTILRGLDTGDATTIRDLHSTERPERIKSLAVTSNGKYVYLGVYRDDASINSYLTSVETSHRTVTGERAKFKGFPGKLAITPNDKFVYVVAAAATEGNVTVVDITPEE